MSNQIKFTDQELTEIKFLQGKFHQKVFEFGRFRIERMHLLGLVKNLEDREEQAEKEYKNYQDLENALLDTLTKKYGEGSLNIEDGVFIPAVLVTSKEKAGI